MNKRFPMVACMFLAVVAMGFAQDLPPLHEVEPLPPLAEVENPSVTLPDTSNEAGDFEAPPVVSAAAVLGAAGVAGPHFRVRDQVVSDGFLYHFVVDSDYGLFQCVGTSDLAETLTEIAAIAKLTEVSKGDLFADAMKKSIEQPIDAVRNIADDPAGAIKEVPNTVGHFFNKVGSSVGNAAKKIGHRVSNSDSGDTAAAVGTGVAEGAKSVAGFSKAKLDCAKQLGVDPYSDNARLQEELEKVAWVFFAGGMPLRIGAMVASGGASVALTATNTVGLPEEIYALTPGELDLRDREAMAAMGASDQLMDQIFLHPVLSLSQRHSMINAISSFPAGKSRVAMIEMMQGLEDSGKADFLVHVFQQLAERHKQSNYTECKLIGRLPAGVTNDGVVEVVAPVDHVFWTPQVAEFAQRQDMGDLPRRLVLLGSISDMASAGFAAAGWKIVNLR